MPVRIRATGNPGGPHHDWIKHYFVDPATRPAGVVDLASRWSDNPYLNLDEYKKQLAHLPPAERERLINGDWDIPDDGHVLQRHRFPRSSTLPTFPRWSTRAVRYWDLAASVPTPSNPDPDYTVGLRLDLDRRGSTTSPASSAAASTPAPVEQLIAATAEQRRPRRPDHDRTGTRLLTATTSNNTSSAKSCAATACRPHGSPPPDPKKAARTPSPPPQNKGWINLVKGPHTREFLDELSPSSPMGRHDDCVDALSGAHEHLSTRPQGTMRTYVPKGRIPTQHDRFRPFLGF